MGPFIRSKDLSHKIKLRLLLSLIPFILFSFYKNGFVPFSNNEVGIKGLFYPILFIFISIVLSFVFETVYYLIFKKNHFKKYIKEYNPIDSILLSLILPINTKLYLLVIAIFILSSLKVLSMKLKIGINPVVIAYLVISFLSYKYSNSSYIYLVLCILSFIYLTFTETIKWKISISYILTIFLITYVIGTYFNYSIYYPISFIINTIFISIYVITDTESSCVTAIGQIFEGMFLAILTILFMSFNLDGLISVIIINLFVNVFDNVGSISKFNIMKSLGLFMIAWVLIISICMYFVISKNFNNDIINSTLQVLDYK